MSEPSDQIEEMLEAVAAAKAARESARRAAELALQEDQSQRLQAIAQMTRKLAELVMTTNSQAIRRQVIHSLYWDAQIKAELISEVFGLTKYQVAVTAGPPITIIPCSGCGVMIEHVEIHHGQLKQFVESLSEEERAAPPGSGRYRFDDTCEACDRTSTLQADAELRVRIAQAGAASAARCAREDHLWQPAPVDEGWDLGIYLCYACGATARKIEPKLER